jgi:hypothetical protein
MENIEKFLKEAKEGIVTVEFKKIDSDEIRVMPCTLNNNLSNNKVPESMNQSVDNDHFAVWSLDKNAWRSFRVSTVVRWYSGEPIVQPEN